MLQVNILVDMVEFFDELHNLRVPEVRFQEDLLDLDFSNIHRILLEALNVAFLRTQNPHLD